MRFGDEEGGAHELVDDVLDLLLGDRREQAVERAELSDLTEDAPQLWLEDDSDGDEAEGEERLEHELRETQLHQHREPIHRDEHEHAEKELDRARAADEDEYVVDEDRDDEDVEDVGPATALPAEQLIQLIVDPAH